jgi:hypothetical protein
VKVLPLKDIKSLAALNGYYALLVGIHMLPAYGTIALHDFLDGLERLPIDEKEKVLRQGVKIVHLEPDEIEAMVCFCVDPNGVSYKKENIKNLNPFQLVECVLAVCMEFAKMEISLISESEKKNLKTSASISEVSL